MTAVQPGPRQNPWQVLVHPLVQVVRSLSSTDIALRLVTMVEVLVSKLLVSSFQPIAMWSYLSWQVSVPSLIQRAKIQIWIAQLKLILDWDPWQVLYSKLMHIMLRDLLPQKCVHKKGYWFWIAQSRVRVKYGDDGDDGDDGVVVNFNGHISVVYPLWIGLPSLYFTLVKVRRSNFAFSPPKWNLVTLF
jgi:hypothetical protein